jgi:hypothetical protein
MIRTQATFLPFLYSVLSHFSLSLEYLEVTVDTADLFLSRQEFSFKRHSI